MKLQPQTRTQTYMHTYRHTHTCVHKHTNFKIKGKLLTFTQPMRCGTNSEYLFKGFRIICLFICMNIHSNKKVIQYLVYTYSSLYLSKRLATPEKNIWVGVLRFQANNNKGRRNHLVC